MIKKAFILTIMSMFSIIIFSPFVHAATNLVSEPAANEGGLWHVEDGNRVYVYMRYFDGNGSDIFTETGLDSNQFYPDLDYSLYTKFFGWTQDLSFPNTSTPKEASINNPNPSIYGKFVVEMISCMFGNENDLPTFKTIATYTEVIDEVTITMHDYEDNIIISGSSEDYSYLSLSVDGNEILNSRHIDTNPYKDDEIFGIKMYWQAMEINDPIDPNDTSDPDASPWDALPETTGSPSNPIGDWGSVSDITVVDHSVSFDIYYLGTIYPVSSFLVEGDLDFINKANDVLYYSDPDTGDRILYFNFGETLSSAILTARSFPDVHI